MSLSLSDEINSKGWAKLELSVTDTPNIDLANWSTFLGMPIPSKRGGSLVDILRVRSDTEASPWSLSAKFGKGAFPFHTDQAKLRIPPRYIVLRCRQLQASRRPTLIQLLDNLNLSSSDYSILCRAMWIVNGGRGSFLSPILTKDHASGASLLRFDMNCMNPAHSRFGLAASILSEALSQTKPIYINWYEGLTVVLDNWRILHARGNNEILDSEDTVNEKIEKRELERVLVLATN